MTVWIIKLSLGVSLHHPLIDFGSFTTAIKDFIDVVPCHSVYLNLELMLHLLVFILRLFGEIRDIRRNIPPFDHEISATCDEHIVFAVIDVDHIEQYVFVLSNNQIFF